MNAKEQVGKSAAVVALVDGKYSVRDLVDIDKLRTILARFSAATGFTTGFVAHPSMDILIGTGWRDICTKFHRPCKASALRCKESNSHLTRQLASHNKISIKSCGNGLVDGATPVIVKGVHIASLFTGQVFSAPPDRQRFRRQARKYGFDEADYLEAISKVPIVSEARLRKALSFLSDVAVMIAELGCQRLQAEEQAVRLRSLTAQLASAQDDEQRRIAEGLHDDVAQLLAACSIKLGIASQCEDPAKFHAKCESINGIIQEANHKIRCLSFELSSSILHHLGLRKAIQELCGVMRERYGVQFTVQGATALPALDRAAATVVFKAVRELLFNVVKHAGVKGATVRIGGNSRVLFVSVEDRGKGFSGRIMRKKNSPSKGLGLFGIEERLRDMNGVLRIESEPNVCTRVTIRVPVGERKRKPSRVTD